jgi:AcrR family transcriptional regulator
MAPKFTRNKEEKINEILDSVLILSRRKGANNFSINDIPEIADVSIGTVYRYFPRGKEDILRRILLRNIENIRKIHENVEVAETIEEYWRPIIGNMMEVSSEYDAISDVIVEAAPRDSEFYQELSNDLMDFYGSMANQLKKLPNIIEVPAKNLTLRIGLCFRLLKKILQAQQAVSIFENDDLEEYMMKIVKATLYQKLYP